MLSDELGAATADIHPMPLKPPHFPRKAKHCIFLFMAGGASQIDTFDYKPALQKYAGGRFRSSRSERRDRRLPRSAASRDSQPIRVQALRPMRPLDVQLYSRTLASAWTIWRSSTESRWTTTITDRRRCMSTPGHSCKAARRWARGSPTGSAARTEPARLRRDAGSARRPR